MIRFEREIVLGLIRKGLILLLPVSGVALFFGGWRVALGVAAGEALMLGNIVLISWMLGRSLGAKEGEQKSAVSLVSLFIVKLLVLFGLSYYVLAVVGLDPIGFVTGCMLSLVTLSWQVVTTTGEGEA